MPAETREDLIQASRRLCSSCGRIRFHDPVRYVYNPLDYAGSGHEEYLRRFGGGRKHVVFLGMNPGPWGMAQTGIPFGDVASVRDWMGVWAPVSSPRRTHPRVAITGFRCPRGEVSGSRLWGLMRSRYGSPREFFRAHLVLNYCPLLFLDASGRNITPDRLSALDREPLVRACDTHLRTVVEVLQPRWLIGIGRFAQSRLEALYAAQGWNGLSVTGIPHPSPASPRANRDWAGQATTILLEAGVW